MTTKWSTNPLLSICENQKQALIISTFILIYFINSVFKKIFFISLNISIFIFITIFFFFAVYVCIKNKTFYLYDIPFSGNKNLAASFLFMLLPFSCINFFNKRKKSAIISLLTLIMTALIIILLRSRVVLFSTCFCFSILLISFNFRKKIITRKWLRFLIIVIGISVLSLPYIVNKYSNENIQNSYINFTSLNERMVLLNKTKYMIMEHFMKGVGIGNWKIIFPSYGLNELPQTADDYYVPGQSQFINVIVQRCHNDLAQIFAETGFIGFLILILLFFYICKIYFKNNYSYKLTIYFIFFIGFLLISSFDFPKERIEHSFAMCVWLCSFLFINKEKRKFKLNIISSRLILLILLTINVIGLYFIYRGITAEKLYKKIYIAKEKKNWQNVVIFSKETGKLYTSMDNFSIPARWYEGVGLFMQNKFNDAEKCFRSAYLLNPNNIYVISNYGIISEINGKRERAKTLLLKTLRISPQFKDAKINLARIYFKERAFKSVINLLKTEINDYSQSKPEELEKLSLELISTFKK
ncbi:MAG: hypothetical protein A3G23_04090 [Bacteroidetes bacterium RIFCSPLOWO2_12_FULL_37_12]|nr:MAG: hypothetical protein A3G23_04090 [Bacteroidetes bacterium RIFCSPLOWO2_12_FULL_37_12]